MVKARRNELRRMAETRIAAIETKAIVEIELGCLEAQTAIAASGLTSEAARAFLTNLPSVESLMPALSYEAVAGEAKPPRSSPSAPIRPAFRRFSTCSIVAGVSRSSFLGRRSPSAGRWSASGRWGRSNAARALTAGGCRLRNCSASWANRTARRKEEYALAKAARENFLAGWALWDEAPALETSAKSAPRLQTVTSGSANDDGYGGDYGGPRGGPIPEDIEF